MAEHRLFDGDVPWVSTFEFHKDRDRGPHLEQPAHAARLDRAAAFARQAVAAYGARTVCDLGCGDGGLLSVIQGGFISAWGYDFTPANIAAWPQRGVTGYALDCFGPGRDAVKLGDLVVMTEVLEHLADPHGVLAWARQAPWLVCSSPFTETAEHHIEEHAWAWDMAGYADMITKAGWTIQRHEQAGGWFQVVLAT